MQRSRLSVRSGGDGVVRVVPTIGVLKEVLKDAILGELSYNLAVLVT